MFGMPGHMKLKKDIWVLLSSILIIHLAAYLIVPIFPILLKTEKKLNPSEVGLVIGAGSLFIQLGSIIAGLIADRLGNKITIILGNALQFIALLGLGLSTNTLPLIAFSGLNGVGTGIYVPTAKSAISYLATQEEATTAFSLRAVAANIGTSIAGIFVLFIATNMNFFVGGIIYGILIVISWILLPKGCGDQPCPSLPLRDYINIFKHKTFVIFSLISALIWGIHTQLALLLPLRGEAILGNVNKIGIIWTITSIIVILLQSMISRGFLEKRSPMLSLVIGTALLGIGITLIGWSNTFVSLIIYSIIFIFGQMFMMPTMDNITKLIADPSLLGAYFAVANLASGVGGAFGAFASGRLVDLYGIVDSPIPWVTYGILSVVTVLLLQLPSMRKIKA
ncbi:Major Facilitator Superfamily protein [Natronincola peptidivorans]|uniref:Major Facilitator Superfamily protein n=1 Tax=Natronincola peptidivorans TaxID=426128 RepID=A0A1I0D9G7_9FIRM|nr:MFS transporter [Natronincola peptidivorans]SET28923.1 Major Facilitator Superfamily protein [Natronincola peptidivorans]